ncbi:MAG TPA: holo-ACP synthase [Solirubrobacteraceae bacterium]|nr:holo-ACP synthase [Solirubrobacteraceae bacterium]
MFDMDCGAGVGIDLEDPRRLAAALERRPRLADRLFTASERAYAHAQADPTAHLTARFCAKEAVTKALALETFDAQGIEIVGGRGEARVQLHGAAAARAEELGVRVLVSLTHTAEMAASVAWAVPAR